MEEVLARFFSGESSEDEIKFVNNWKSESESNAKAFFDAKLIWLSTDKTDTSYQGVLNDILKEEPKQKQVFWSSAAFKYVAAASVILLMCIVFVLRDSETFLNYSSTDLPDGSVISLHSNSSLETLNFSEDVREVRVLGKAYFDIERDENRPFIIHTENAVVKVLGTSFVIDSYNNKTEVFVESGLVELVKESDKDVSVKLAKGEVGLVNNLNKGILKGENEDVNYLSWKTKELNFNNSSMNEVAKTLEDVYGIEVEIENDSFRDCTLTAKINNKKPKDALEIISRTFNIEFELSKKKAILKGKGC
ncbi:MAG: FecR family protein [Ekhidna sp.]